MGDKRNGKADSDMVIFIAGASHTGKTLLAQRLLEKYSYPYMSIDHLKMGLIRSGNTHLTPESPIDALEKYLWPIVREIAKTTIENQQNLVIEGCYIPYGFKKDFAEEYLRHIQSLWLIFTLEYINRNFATILEYESAVECRTAKPQCLKEEMIEASKNDLAGCKLHCLPYILINDSYEINLDVLAP